MNGIERLEQKVDDLVKKVDEQNHSINEIKSSLFEPDKGVFQRINKVRTEADSNTKFRKAFIKFGWIIITAVSAGLARLMFTINF